MDQFIHNLGVENSLDIITRNGRTAQVISLHPNLEQDVSMDTYGRSNDHDVPVWVSRERTAPTESGLSTAKWVHLEQCDDQRFQRAVSPEHNWSKDFSADAMEIFVMDCAENVHQNRATFNDFMWKVAGAGLKAQGYEGEMWHDVFGDVGRMAEGVWEERRRELEDGGMVLGERCGECGAGGHTASCADKMAKEGARNM